MKLDKVLRNKYATHVYTSLVRPMKRNKSLAKRALDKCTRFAIRSFNQRGDTTLQMTSMPQMYISRSLSHETKQEPCKTRTLHIYMLRS